MSLIFMSFVSSVAERFAQEVTSSFAASEKTGVDAGFCVAGNTSLFAGDIRANKETSRIIEGGLSVELCNFTSQRRHNLRIV